MGQVRKRIIFKIGKMVSRPAAIKERVVLWLVMLAVKKKQTKAKDRPMVICHQNCGGTVKKKPIAVIQAKISNNREWLMGDFCPCLVGFSFWGR